MCARITNFPNWEILWVDVSLMWRVSGGSDGLCSNFQEFVCGLEADARRQLNETRQECQDAEIALANSQAKT